jgi:hypothetical protein
MSFRGVGVFNQHGQLHNTAFSCLHGEGNRELYTNMQEGRPAHHSHMSSFYPDDRTAYVTSKETESDVSGWQFYSGETDKQGRASGHGKHWYNDGDVYIGGYEKDNATKGKRYVLQENGTYTLYECKGRSIGKELSKGHKYA